MNHKFTQKAQNALQSALQFARELGHTYIGSEHLLLGLAAFKLPPAFPSEKPNN